MLKPKRKSIHFPMYNLKKLESGGKKNEVSIFPDKHRFKHMFLNFWIKHLQTSNLYPKLILYITKLDINASMSKW